MKPTPDSAGESLSPKSTDGPRFASSNGPVNRRTVRQPLPKAQAPQAHASLRQRLAQVQVRHRLGTPLSQRLAPGQVGSVVSGRWGRLVGRGVAVQHAPVSRASLAAGGVLTLCGLGLFVATLESSWALAGVALGGAAATGGAWWGWQRRRTATRLAFEGAAADTVPLFDTTALAQLDEVLHHLASDMSETQLVPLRQLADTLERMAPLMRRVGVNEQFTQEDHFYVTECVRRYLPDTLQAYLQVPRHSRAEQAVAQPGAPGTPSARHALPSADDLLAAQLALLNAELARREQALTHASTEALAKQQRFLLAKGAGRVLE